LRGFVLFLAASLSVFNRGTELIDFDKMPVGSPPPNWSFASSQPRLPGRWIVHPDVSAPSAPHVLAQLEPARVAGRHAIALYDNGYCKNGDLSVEMKIVSGKSTQTGGLVWRYQDPQNYYLLTVSADEDTIAAVRFQDGHPTPIARLGPGLRAFQVNHRIEPQEWNVLRVAFLNSHLTVYFDHRKVMDAEDVSIMKPGKTGLWTRGDTIAYFDNFRLEKKKD
jgi:hypothetical protein